jgi:hypothetical protein
MWEFIKSEPWMFGVFVLAAVLSTVGIVVGVVKRGGWKDRGFLMREGSEARWPMGSMPLTVWFHRDLPSVYAEAFCETVEHFNDSVGGGLFCVPLSAPDAFCFERLPPGSVAVVPKTGIVNPATDIHWLGGATIHSALIEVPPIEDMLSERWADQIALHELGHALGLDHDEQVASIMYPVVSDRPQALTKADIARLRRVYAPK